MTDWKETLGITDVAPLFEDVQREIEPHLTLLAALVKPDDQLAQERIDWAKMAAVSDHPPFLTRQEARKVANILLLRAAEVCEDPSLTLRRVVMSDRVRVVLGTYLPLEVRVAMAGAMNERVEQAGRDFAGGFWRAGEELYLVKSTEMYRNMGCETWEEYLSTRVSVSASMGALQEQAYRLAVVTFGVDPDVLNTIKIGNIQEMTPHLNALARRLAGNPKRGDPLANEPLTPEQAREEARFIVTTAANDELERNDVGGVLDERYRKIVPLLRNRTVKAGVFTPEARSLYGLSDLSPDTEIIISVAVRLIDVPPKPDKESTDGQPAVDRAVEQPVS